MLRTLRFRDGIELVVSLVAVLGIIVVSLAVDSPDGPVTNPRPLAVEWGESSLSQQSDASAMLSSQATPAGTSSGVARAGSASKSLVVVHRSGQRHVPRKAFDGPLPRFVQSTVTEAGGIEPPLAFGSDGALFFVSATPADPPDIPATLFRSDDGGRTWIENVPEVAGVAFNDRGIDPYLYRDATTGRLFYVLYYIGGTHIAWTDDEGKTWGHPIQARIHDPAGLTDYPKLWTSRPVDGATTPAGAPFYVHLCWQTPWRLECLRSIDGGLSFAPSPSPYPDAQREYVMSGCRGFLPGWAISSPNDGTIYMPKEYCGKLEVAISRDNGITWERSLVTDTAQLPEDAYKAPMLAIDRNENLYYLWIDGGENEDGKRVMLSISRDRGNTWSQPIDVGVPGITAVKFGSIVAGDDGRVAFYYLGSKVPGGFEASEDHMKNARWDAYVGITLDALAQDPIFATAMVNPVDDPLRRGRCQGRCEPEPGVGMMDYLQIALDPTSGMVATSLVDLCAGKCGTSQGSSDDEWSWIGAVGVQVSGPSLFKKLPNIE